MRKFVALSVLLSLLAFVPAQAEVQLPQPSPRALVKTVIGTTEVGIEYHRPGVKGRKIWGGLVPYDEVWRLGANEATTIQLEHAVKIDGRDVPAGTYALFAIPGQDTWTLILNKQPQQWGAYFYKQEQDLLRFTVKPQTGPFTEWMVFNITPSGPKAATVEMAWENLRVPFTIEVDVPAIVWKDIDAALASNPDWGTYLQAANYAMAEGQRMDQAMGWIDKSLALRESFWNHEAKAKLLQREGKL
ncbi:MAG TPA: DUF2911 domain-containing protein, partial [Thermoanaerobaculia bacterium]